MGRRQNAPPPTPLRRQLQAAHKAFRTHWESLLWTDARAYLVDMAASQLRRAAAFASAPVGFLLWPVNAAVNAWASKAMYRANFQGARQRWRHDGSIWRWDASVLETLLADWGRSLAVAACAIPAVFVFMGLKDNPVLLIGGGVFLGLPSLILSIWVGMRLFPATYLAADGNPRALSRAWDCSRGHAAETFEYLVAAYGPVWLILFLAGGAAYALWAWSKFLTIMLVLAALPPAAYFGARGIFAAAAWAAHLDAGAGKPKARRPRPPAPIRRKTTKRAA